MNHVNRIGAVVLALLLATPVLAAEKYEVDASHSTAMFRIKHLNVSWFYGRFVDVTGTINYDATKPGESSFDISVKTESVNTDNAKRDKHLKSPDFFAAKQFPTLSFKSTSVKAAGDNALEVTGQFTCHGVTKPLTVKIDVVGQGKDPWGGFRAGFETKFKIKRSDFGMNYMPEGLGDEVEILVSLEGARK